MKQRILPCKFLCFEASFSSAIHAGAQIRERNTALNEHECCYTAGAPPSILSVSSAPEIHRYTHRSVLSLKRRAYFRRYRQEAGRRIEEIVSLTNIRIQQRLA